ncbi:unnamed protein product [Echinostoma caproni]|uniref:EF-hand domain-containing protein n=1 Tax=Echinostoma caproni TaxID=27848 RepID=A0A183BGP1_9TREM|nr:unnamed protein product [Echinostoma caproni]
MFEKNLRGDGSRVGGGDILFAFFTLNQITRDLRHDGLKSVTLEELHELAGDLKDHPMATENAVVHELISVLKDPRLPLFGYNPENISLLLLPMLKTRYCSLLFLF